MMERMCMQAVCLSRVVVEVDPRDNTRPPVFLGRFPALLCLYLSPSPVLVRFACLVAAHLTSTAVSNDNTLSTIPLVLWPRSVLP